MIRDWKMKLPGFLVFIISMFVYLKSMAPTVSLWDCGEFIACSYKLMVPHPPGAPFFLLFGRIASLIPLFSDIAARINFMSVVSSATTVWLLFLTIQHFGFKLLSGENITSRIIVKLGAMIGALTFAFTHSFWFNAVEAEVYAMSMLFTALVVYLILVWDREADTRGNERYLLIIFYLVGLAIGVHLLNVLALPFVFLIYFFRKYGLNIKTGVAFFIIAGGVFLLIYPGIIFGVPEIILRAGFLNFGVLVVIMVGLIFALRKKSEIISFALLSVFLVLIGYSTYCMVYIRSNQNPNIDENNPETVKNLVSYLKREQYGEHTLSRRQVWQESPNGKNYQSVGDFFWNYQVQKMFNRYFGWQFLGMADDEYHVDPGRFWFMPFLLGLLGMFFQFKKDGWNAFSVLALFFMTGYAIILYLNQPDPQPRERDYSYVGAFFAFSIWVGLGATWLIHQLTGVFRQRNVFTSVAIGVLLLLIGPGRMLAKEFYRHSRAGNYLASDYAHNILTSVEKNAILFTNGDNDTFPLWYLQEVEGFRQDVRVINLSLLNATWYVYQLKHGTPQVPTGLSDRDIKRLDTLVYSSLWETRKVKIGVPHQYQLNEWNEKQKWFKDNQEHYEAPGYIEFKLKPKMNGGLRMQDYMILRIMHENQWKRPVYFSITCPQSAMLDELQNYLRIDGMAYKITSQKNWTIHPEKVENNILKKFRYRNLDNNRVFYRKDDQASLMANYRSLFYELAQYYTHHMNFSRAKNIMNQLHKTINTTHLSYNSPQTQYLDYLHSVGSGEWPVDSLLSLSRSPRELSIFMGYIADNYYQSPYFDSYFAENLKKHEKNPTYYEYIASRYFEYLENRGDIQKLKKVLAEALKLYPNFRQAKIKMDKMQ